MRENGNKVEQYDSVDGIRMGQKVTFEKEIWEVCALENNSPLGKPIGITKPGFANNGHTAEPTWVALYQIKPIKSKSFKATA